MKVKIIGAGSIGNHLAQASRRMGWDVVVVDSDPKALQRMEEEIYPKRYGRWDKTIKLVTSQEEQIGGFDIICIGTPPDIRINLAKKALAEKPKILQLEKPLCPPRLEGLKEFIQAYYSQKETSVIVGYDHGVAQATSFVCELLKSKSIGEVLTIDVEFREHWQGIFSAHAWLSGPEDTYLGFWQRGGGASGEHSHALHLWQLLANCAGFGKWRKISSFMKMEKEGDAEFDSLVAFLIETDLGKVGRVIQDVITLPVRKWARIQGKIGFIEWVCNGHPNGDLVRYSAETDNVMEKVFEKKRPDDFYQEMLHIKDIIDGKVSRTESPLSLESAVAVMEVLSTAHQNRNQTSEVIKII